LILQEYKHRCKCDLYEAANSRSPTRETP